MKILEKMAGVTELYLVGAILLCLIPAIFSGTYTDRLININTALILGGMLIAFMTLVRK